MMFVCSIENNLFCNTRFVVKPEGVSNVFLTKPVEAVAYLGFQKRAKFFMANSAHTKGTKFSKFKRFLCQKFGHDPILP